MPTPSPSPSAPPKPPSSAAQTSQLSAPPILQPSALPTPTKEASAVSALATKSVLGSSFATRKLEELTGFGSACLKMQSLERTRKRIYTTRQLKNTTSASRWRRAKSKTWSLLSVVWRKYYLRSCRSVAVLRRLSKHSRVKRIAAKSSTLQKLYSTRWRLTRWLTIAERRSNFCHIGNF